MSKFFQLAKRSKAPVKARRRSRTKIKLDISIINSTIITLLIVIGVSYLIQVNGLVTKGYTIKELESKISQLEKSGNDLELQVLELQSMDNVKSKVTQLNMVSVDEVDYLSPTPVALVTP